MGRDRDSDEPRLPTPPHVRVNLSIRHGHPDYPTHREVFDDPELRGVWLGMQIVAASHRAYAQGGEAILSPTDLAWITKRSHRDSQRALAQRVAHQLDYPTRLLEAGLLVTLHDAADDPFFHYALKMAGRRRPAAADERLVGNVADMFLIERQRALEARQRQLRREQDARDRGDRRDVGRRR